MPPVYLATDPFGKSPSALRHFAPVLGTTDYEMLFILLVHCPVVHCRRVQPQLGRGQEQGRRLEESDLLRREPSNWPTAGDSAVVRRVEGRLEALRRRRNEHRGLLHHAGDLVRHATYHPGTRSDDSVHLRRPGVGSGGRASTPPFPSRLQSGISPFAVDVNETATN